MGDYTLSAFIAKCEKDFGLPKIRVYKEKASHLMCSCDGYNVDMHGPGVGGYANQVSYQSITINGWAYVLGRDDGEWYLIRDGALGHRHGENPYPNIPLRDVYLFGAWH